MCSFMEGLTKPDTQPAVLVPAELSVTAQPQTVWAQKAAHPAGKRVFATCPGHPRGTP